MSSVDIDTVMPQDLINAKPAAAAVREFFGSSQLSQFMDQTNPLSEITHKRRLSALGPGGLTRERAGFEVRDVHPTHYGRICPIETPEGPNIGLINSLATFARVNKYGFIESPYRKVVEGRVTDEVVYLSAMEESKYTVAQANAVFDPTGKLTEDLVVCRQAGENVLVTPDRVDFMDVSPKQLVSVAAALIPFLENDDANRALMGSNMQRQAVPLVRAEAPFVGTGMEPVVARDSGAAIGARRGGVVDQVDATRIVIRATEDLESSKSGVDIYRLMKFQRSNQSTCINQRPLVRVGDVVSKGDIIADGPSTDLGDLALGRNVLVAFMPWNGYNFEDSILLSEKIVSDDVFTSIHIDEFEVMARDTKLGPEEITRDIPNVSEEALKNLDEAGIVYIGADVQAGDILVGKITPKGESPMTPEEKLLRAIFGEKASDVRDTSLRVPRRDRHHRGSARLQPPRRGEGRARHGDRARGDRAPRQGPRRRAGDPRPQRLRPPRGHAVRQGRHRRPEGLQEGHRTRPGAPGGVSAVAVVAVRPRRRRADGGDRSAAQAVRREPQAPRAALHRQGGEAAARRRAAPGRHEDGQGLRGGEAQDPAGRQDGRPHGNKGVVSRIVPVEDMPFLEDGTHVDIVLNPLGVPSRMNVGQILETHLGWACAGMGKRIGEMLEAYRQSGAIEPLRERIADTFEGSSKTEKVREFDDASVVRLAEQVKKGVSIATPVFDGAREPDVVKLWRRRACTRRVSRPSTTGAPASPSTARSRSATSTC